MICMTATIALSWSWVWLRVLLSIYDPVKGSDYPLLQIHPFKKDRFFSSIGMEGVNVANH